MPAPGRCPDIRCGGSRSLHPIGIACWHESCKGCRHDPETRHGWPAPTDHGRRPGIRDTAAQDRVLVADPRDRRKRLLRNGGLAAIALVAAALLLPRLLDTLSATRSVSADRLRIATVERGLLVRDLAVQGRIVAAVSPTLYAPAAGTVGFLVQPGDEVELGRRWPS